MAHPVRNEKFAWVERFSMSTAILANAISALEQRLGGQETRIMNLEKEVRQYQIDRIINSSTSLPLHTANVALFSKYLYHHAKAQCLAPPPTPEQEQQHSGAHPNSSSLSTTAPALTPVTSNPSSCHPDGEVKSPLDSSPGEMMASTKVQTPYHVEDFNAFESRMVAHPKGSISVVAPPPRELPTTLLEGIGSADQITHHQKGDGSGVQSCVEEDVNAVSLDSKQKSDPRKCLEAQPWDGTIAWVTTSAFKDPDQEKKALTLQPHSSSWVGLFQHGLVFQPRDDENAYRTVILTYLPLDVEMKSLLEAVRGGEIFEAHIMNTGIIAGFHIGVVTFVREKDAVAYANFAAVHGVYFNNQRAKVVLSPTPTYPISKFMESNILRQGYTRCISISGESDPDRYTAVALHIMDELPTYFTSGDSIVENEEETELTVRFNSIKAAAAAMASLRLLPLLSDCDLDFAADPCSQSLPAELSSDDE